MARNEEKAQSMLNRFIAMKQEEKRKPKERRPYLASECRDLAEADRWRSEILREIGAKVAEIQNEGLGEHRLRDLNDEINKLLRERAHWERRIGNIVDVPNPSGRGPGYRYFGAAKKLPGVRELFEKPPEAKRRRTRYDIYKRIDASYYGYRDDEDGSSRGLKPRGGGDAGEGRGRVAPLESIRREAMKAVKSGEVATAGAPEAAAAAAAATEDVVDEERRLEREREEREQSKESEFVAHVPLPDEKEIERMIVEKKKEELLSRYTSDVLQEEQKEAMAMLNVRRLALRGAPEYPNYTKHNYLAKGLIISLIDNGRDNTLNAAC
ncbi:Pre-mRNA-splicing factor ISY [Ananas comosus]|uniref:Pre-mRNA-splicing factor ISY n=1 Tax=Ananas comosus TaxID=4615 RepID=A0A199W5K4_ANACO|nr:Pre-mRNA-splicing factor ISY [Ananas comosus]